MNCNKCKVEVFDNKLDNKHDCNRGCTQDHSKETAHHQVIGLVRCTLCYSCLVKVGKYAGIFEPAKRESKKGTTTTACFRNLKV